LGSLQKPEIAEVRWPNTDARAGTVTSPTGGGCDDALMTALSERARTQATDTAKEREGVKMPRGGPRSSDHASRWELLKELEDAYNLIAELAEKVEALERDRDR
jgi:hypothetical protein